MSSDRRHMPEQESSIKERGQELFLESTEAEFSATPVKPFAVYLRETPATPLAPAVKATLWIVGVVVLILFVAAIWRSQRPSKPRPRARPAGTATVSFVLPAPCLRLDGDGGMGWAMPAGAAADLRDDRLDLKARVRPPGRRDEPRRPAGRTRVVGLIPAPASPPWRARRSTRSTPRHSGADGWAALKSRTRAAVTRAGTATAA
jgi:hypothetical protein